MVIRLCILVWNGPLLEINVSLQDNSLLIGNKESISLPMFHFQIRIEFIALMWTQEAFTVCTKQWNFTLELYWHQNNGGCPVSQCYYESWKEVSEKKIMKAANNSQFLWIILCCWRMSIQFNQSTFSLLKLGALLWPERDLKLKTASTTFKVHSDVHTRVYVFTSTFW